MAPALDGPHRRRRWRRLLVVPVVAAGALAVVTGFTGASAPGPAPARLAWWTPPSHSDVVLHLRAATACEHRDGWFTTRRALDGITVEERPERIVVTARLAAESLRSSEPRGCDVPQPIAVDVRLAEPLGQRVVLDGRCRPAAPPVGPDEHPGACP